jgi:DNA-binding XRE family transcriptional regulator
MTQEQLAEYYEVSTRTIQHIENGEVEPRAYTRNSLSNILEFDFGQDNTEHQSFWLAALHISSIFIIVLIPLLLWSWKKNQSYEVDPPRTAGAQLPDYDELASLWGIVPDHLRGAGGDTCYKSIRT